MTTHGNSASSKAVGPEHLFTCNIRTESNGTLVNLNGGGGKDPQVNAWNVDYKEGLGRNQIWTFWTLPDSDAVVIRSQKNGEYMIALGHDTRISTAKVNWTDYNAQWYVEGGNVRSLSDYEPVRIRSKGHPDCVLDLEGGKGHETPFLCYKINGGKNQQFRLIKK